MSLEYTIRAPRFDAAQVDADVAALLFVQRLAKVEHRISKRPEIPSSQVIMFDWTENKCLQSPFMIQKRLRGWPLIDVFPQLYHEQQRRVAQELGQAYRQMLAVSSTQARRLVLPEDDKTLDAELQVTPWDPNAAVFRNFKMTRKPWSTTPYRAGRDGDSVLELLRRTFQGQKTEILERLPKDSLRLIRLDQFCIMANEEPATVEQKELKEVFEAAAGASYFDAAYHPAYRLARRLGHFAIDSIRTKEENDESEAMLNEWQNLLLEEVSRNVWPWCLEWLWWFPAQIVRRRDA